MQTFIAAYVIVWLGVVAFMTRMALRQRRLETTIRAIEDARRCSEERSALRSNAA